MSTLSTLAAPILDAPTVTRRSAVVKWYSLAKGYGFAHLPGDDRDVFLHHSEIEDGQPLVDGEKIELELGEGARGLFGARIRRPVTAPAP